jgi:hypothetical protein
MQHERWQTLYNIVTWLNIHGVWTGNRIYWTLREGNYKQLRQSHWVTHSTVHCNYSTHKVFSVFTSCCLVTASNGGHSASFECPNSPQPQLPTFHLSQLQLTTDSTTTAQKKSLPLLCVLLLPGNMSTELLPSNGFCTVSCLHGIYLAMGLHVTVCYPHTLNPPPPAYLL